MKRALALLIAVCLLPLSLRAGETVVSFADAGTSDKGSNWTGTNNWANLTTKKAKARINGIGLAPAASDGEQSGMVATFDPPEEMTSLAVTCMASGTTAAKAKHLLGVRLNGGELLTAELAFPDSAVDTPVTLTFPFAEKQSVTTLAITNETAKNSGLFEVNAVAWQSDFAPIVATLSSTAEVCNVGETFYAVLSKCEGGSGEYVNFRWRFNGQEQEADDFATVCPFTAPMEDGKLPLELEVTDSLGTVATFSWEVTIRPYIKATNLAYTPLSRTGMTVTWDQPLPHAVSAYEVRVSYASARSLELMFAPTWERDGDRWRLAEPIQLADLVGVRDFTAYLVPFHWQGEGLELSTDGGTTWCKTIVLSSTPPRHLLRRTLESGAATGTFTSAHTSLLLRTAADTPPDFFRLYLNLTASLISAKTLPAESNTLQVTFHESDDDIPLPAGEPLSIRVITRYVTDSGSTISLQSPVLNVTLEDVPPINSAERFGDFLCLTWPESAPDLAAEVTFRKRALTPTDGLPDLALSRVYFTGNATSEGGEQLPASKAIVLTNITSRPIALDGAYTFTATKVATGTPYTWDFSLTETDAEGNSVKVYPYVVPAGGELLFYASAYNAPVGIEAFENAFAVTATALRNLNTTYTATFAHGGEALSTFTPQFNAILRLRPADAATQSAYAITAADTFLPAFSIPWFNRYQEATLLQTSASGPYAPITLAGFIADPGDAEAIWATIRLREGNSYSEPLSLTLWEREAPKAGFRFLLH